MEPPSFSRSVEPPSFSRSGDPRAGGSGGRIHEPSEQAQFCGPSRFWVENGRGPRIFGVWGDVPRRPVSAQRFLPFKQSRSSERRFQISNAKPLKRRNVQNEYKAMAEKIKPIVKKA